MGLPAADLQSLKIRSQTAETVLQVGVSTVQLVEIVYAGASLGSKTGEHAGHPCANIESLDLGSLELGRSLDDDQPVLFRRQAGSE